MYKRFAVVLLLATALAPCAKSADAIVINDATPLALLAMRLWNDYGYLVTYEDAPVDPVRETITVISERGRIERSAVYKPITFHVPRGSSTMPSPGIAEGSTAILPLSKELIQSLVDEYNASGNPSKFAVSFDGTYAHIYAAAHSVNGKMEDFQPILATKISMPPQTMPCYQTLNTLYSELKRMRNVNVAQMLIPANWLFRHQCAIVGDDLTARDVLAQVAYEFSHNSVGPVEPGTKACVVWILGYNSDTATYYLNMDWVPEKTPPANVKPIVPEAATGQSVIRVQPSVPSCRTRADGITVCDPRRKQ